MKRFDMYFLLFSFLLSLFNSVLVLLGENRIDVYISISILIYFVALAIFGFEPLTEMKSIKILSIFLFIIFIVIVGLRVYEILYPGVKLLSWLYGGG